MAEEQHSQASQKEEALLQGTKSWPQVRGARGLGQSLRQALVIKCLWASSFPSGSDGKESACEAGDQVRSLGQEDPLEDTHTGPCLVLSAFVVAQPCPTLFNPVDCSTPGLPVHHLLEFAQTCVH